MKELQKILNVEFESPVFDEEGWHDEYKMNPNLIPPRRHFIPHHEISRTETVRRFPSNIFCNPVLTHF